MGLVYMCLFVKALNKIYQRVYGQSSFQSGDEHK